MRVSSGPERECYRGHFCKSPRLVLKCNAFLWLQILISVERFHLEFVISSISQIIITSRNLRQSPDNGQDAFCHSLPKQSVQILYKMKQNSIILRRDSLKKLSSTGLFRFDPRGLMHSLCDGESQIGFCHHRMRTVCT